MDYVKKTYELLDKVKENAKLDFEVLRVDWVKEDGNYYLRIFCNKEGGIGSEDLASITRPLNKLLDKEDFIEEAYTLEVCSPGYMDDVATQDDYDISQLDEEIQEDQDNE